MYVCMYVCVCVYAFKVETIICENICLFLNNIFSLLNEIRFEFLDE